MNEQVLHKLKVLAESAKYDVSLIPQHYYKIFFLST